MPRIDSTARESMAGGRTSLRSLTFSSSTKSLCAALAHVLVMCAFLLSLSRSYRSTATSASMSLQRYTLRLPMAST